MPRPHHERRVARRQALQLLYQSEITSTPVIDLVSADNTAFDGERIEDYALVLCQGVMLNQDTLDLWIEETSQNWSLTRMPMVDRNILRLATYEMLYLDDVPCGASIDEAVELAKQFGGEDESSSFVNGVLGFIANKMETSEIPEEIR